MAKSPQQVASKWSRNLGQASQSIAEGVRGVTESPTEKAAREAQRYVDGVNRAVQDGKWQSALRGVTLEEWREKMLTKGVQRIASGAQASQSKFEKFMADFLPHVEAGQRMLANMPKGDLASNIQRMIAMTEHLAKFRKRS
jgi:hypothetical protein